MIATRFQHPRESLNRVETAPHFPPQGGWHPQHLGFGWCRKGLRGIVWKPPHELYSLRSGSGLPSEQTREPVVFSFWLVFVLDAGPEERLRFGVLPWSSWASHPARAVQRPRRHGARPRECRQASAAGPVPDRASSVPRTSTTFGPLFASSTFPSCFFSNSNVFSIFDGQNVSSDKYVCM